MGGLKLRRWARIGVLALSAGVSLACAGTSELQQPNVPNYGAIAPAASPMPMPASDDAFRVRLVSEPALADPNQRPSVPVGLDTVLRLAEGQNPQIAIARAKVCSAFAEKEAAEARWLPDIYLGVGYWRHEGGIQLQEGPLIHSSTQAFLGGTQVNASWSPRDIAFKQLSAARSIWQQQGELTKVSTEQILEASTTYVDLLAAYSALAISVNLENKLQPLYEKVKTANAAAQLIDLKNEQIRVEAELQLQKQTQRKLQASIEIASAKLAYLLGLDPSSQIVPIDSQMATFHIVDANVPADQLVATALSNGPGIKEMEGILCVIQRGMEQAQGLGRLAPTLDVQVGEGLFGAGPGGTMNFDNRLDMGLQARWNITELLGANHKRQVAFSQINQAHLTYQELRAKLTLGVQDAQNTILSSAAQLAMAEELIKQAKQALQNSTKRFDALERAKAPYSEVMQAHQAVAKAQLNYLDVMREFDRAQLRLMILLGPVGAYPVAASQQLPSRPILQK
jgi:outer membrane protein TolC